MDLSELKLRRTIEGELREHGGVNQLHQPRKTSSDQRGSALAGLELQQLNNNANANKPNVEETVNVITNRLKERRQELGLPDSLKVSKGRTHRHTVHITSLHPNKIKHPKCTENVPVCMEFDVHVMQEMSHSQIAMEKTSLQKCLLYYEGLHGRPVRTAIAY